MNARINQEQTLALTFSASWNRLERRLDKSLGAIRGISLAEYRLLRALGDAPASQASRADLADAVGLTPSGVTRALRPMEKLSIVSTVKSKRDDRMSWRNTDTNCGKSIYQHRLTALQSGLAAVPI